MDLRGIRAIRQRLIARLLKKSDQAWPTEELSPESLSSSKGLGRAGESIALKYLQNKGYRLICSNWKCRIGEIDLVCSLGKQLVFVEVKTLKKVDRRQYLFRSIDKKKSRKLRALAAIYLKLHRIEAQSVSIRIDCVGLEVSGRKVVRIEHLEGAI